MIRRKSKNEFIVSIARDRHREHQNAIDWCVEMFGPGGRNKKCTWRYGWTKDDHYYFKFERDAIAFALRWLA